MKVRPCHLDIVAEDLVVADFQIRYAKSHLFPKKLEGIDGMKVVKVNVDFFPSNTTLKLYFSLFNTLLRNLEILKSNSFDFVEIL